jgi:dihydropyrimidine dehydrogenase (NAD+) subunit PreA
MPKEVSLNLKFAGVEFRSPIGVAVVGRICGKNVTPEEHAGVLLKHLDYGAGYIYIPSCTYLTPETEKKLKETAPVEELPKRKSAWEAPYTKRHMSFGEFGTISGTGGLYFYDLSMAKERLPFREKVTEIIVKKKPKDVPLFASIVGLGDLPDTYADSAKRWEDLGADLIELNLSCPTPPAQRGAVDYFFSGRLPARQVGFLAGDNFDHVERITKAVVKAVKIPVGVKISPETGYPRVVGLARLINQCGAKFIQAINCGFSVAKPDIYNGGKSTWPFSEGMPLGGASGAWLRPTLYKDVAVICRFVPGTEIAAAGGLMEPEHCIEVMMLGAKLTQLCTGIMLKGAPLIRQCDKFMKRFMAEQGYKTVDDFIGLSQKHIKYTDEVDFMSGKLTAVVDESKCTGCGLCETTFCVVPRVEDGVSKIDMERCTGCGTCPEVCPQQAITLALRSEVQARG